MLNFDIAFNFVFLTIFIYHVFYFAVQYAVIRRIELLYYSLFLLSASVYYFVFHISHIFQLSFANTLIKAFAPFEYSFAFIQNYFYISFIVAYLELTKSKPRIYTLLRYYRVYNLLFLLLFPIIYFLPFPVHSFYGAISLFTLPVTIILLIMLWQLNTKYSNVILFGTTFSVVGTITSLVLLTIGGKLTVNAFIPVQTGLTLDLIVLGYGLSLKAAESDKKLVEYLFENQKLLEFERARFARDLHDGLGGLLSSVKFSFNNLKERIDLNSAQNEKFGQGLIELDKGIAELRRIAQNMMPENLHYFGLEVALRDFCFTSKQGSDCAVYFESFGLQQYAGNRVADLAIYRSAQELVNAAIKNSAATEVIVQLQAVNKLLILTVEDNGKNSNLSDFKIERDSIIENIQSRVNLLNGSLSSLINNQGTTVTVEVPI